MSIQSSDIRFSDYRQRFSIVTVVTCTLAISFLSLALPITTLQIYDRILPNQSTGTLAILMLSVSVIILLEVVLRLCRAYLIGLAGAVFVHKLSSAAIQHLLAADISHQTAKLTKEHQALGSVRQLRDFHNGHSLSTCVDLISVPVFLGVIALVADEMFLIPLFGLVLFCIVAWRDGAGIRSALDERERKDSERFNFLVRSLNAVHTAKAFSQEMSLLRRYETLQRDSSRANLIVSKATVGSINSVSLIGQAMTAIVVAWGALAVIEGQMSTGALIAVMLMSGRIMQPVQKALVLWTKYQDYCIGRERVLAIFRMPTVRQGNDDVLPTNHGSLALQDVSYASPNGEGVLLDSVNLRLRVGDAISLSGPSEQAKSQLLKVIAGLVQPTSGKAMINGQSVLDYRPSTLNNHVAYLGSDGAIFRGTIRDNITGFGGVPLGQALQIAGYLGLDQAISRLPAGLDTRLEGSQADSIAPGLKHRITLVRALARKPRIILVENADKSLDMEGYRQLYTLLGRLRRKTAMIIVSEDLNLKMLAPRQMVLENGVLRQVSSQSHVQYTQEVRSAVSAPADSTRLDGEQVLVT